MPQSLISNLKIGDKEPYWLNVPYFKPASDSSDVNKWVFKTDIDLTAVGTQVIINTHSDLTADTTLNSLDIICNSGGLSAKSYPKGSLLHLVYDGTKWTILN